MKRNKNRGFTLIELLVVVAIIGVLCLLLVPVAAKARGSAKTVSCMNRAREVVLGMLMHAEDHDETIPTVSEAASYIDDPDVFVCPEDTRDGLGPSKPSFTTWADTPATLKPSDAEGIYSQNVVFVESDKTGINPDTGSEYNPLEIGEDDIAFRHSPFTNVGCLDGRVWTCTEADLHAIAFDMVYPDETPAGDDE